MFIPGGCFCCDPPEDPCVLSGCTWSSTDMSDTDLTAGTAYYNPVSGTTPDGSYEITNAQETGTGNDAPCRKITIETVEAPQKPDTVYAICWKDDATHNPSTQCPLTSVSFCVESKRHGDSDSGLTDSVVFVVRQNNRIFATAAQSVGVNWKRASGTYTQNSFTEIDGAGNPNFTAAGTSIEFGFALKLLVSEDEEPLDVVMFDNLCITRTAGCLGCICESPVTGEDASGGLVLHSTGAGSSSIGSDGTYGVPPPSVKVQYTQEALSAPVYTFAWIPASSPNLTNTCKTIGGIASCFNGCRESSVNSGGGIGVPCVKQGGVYFVGAGSVSQFISVFGGIPPFSLGGMEQFSQTVLWTTFRNITGYTSSYTPTLGSLTPDQSQSFEYGLLVAIGTTGTMASVYIDNICVRAVYGTCICDCVDNYAVTVSGAGGSGECAGCSSANGTFVMSKITIPSVLRFSSDACAWKAPNVSGVCPSRAAAYAWMLVIGTSGGVPYASLALRQQTSSYTALAGFSVTGFSCEASNTLNGLNVLDLVDGWGGGCTGPATLSVAPV